LDNDTETTPRFEDALAQLEQIVDALERGQPELSTALAKYETGVKLVGLCQSALERAERAVALLTGVDKEENPVTTPFDASATAETPAPAPRTRTRKRPAPVPEDPPIPF
jgi:exodeoxyribonuclease VII small subunit